MTVGRVDHVWFWVADMDRALDFYARSLGLSLRLRHGDDWAELDGGGIRIGLHGAGARERASRGGTVVFEVADVDLEKAALQARGIAFDDHLGEVPGYARYASFRDPDGNELQLIEYLSAESAAPRIEESPR